MGDTIDPSWFGSAADQVIAERQARAQWQDVVQDAHTAAEANDTTALRRLIAAHSGAVTAKDPSRRGRTPLHSATLGGAMDTMQLLLDNGANVNAAAAGGGTPLHYAARYGRLGAATLLLRAGADASAQDRSGDTPADDAAK